MSDDTKRSFLGKKCCRIPDLLKKRQLLTISWVGFKIMIIRERVKLIIILGGYIVSIRGGGIGLLNKGMRKKLQLLHLDG